MAKAATAKADGYNGPDKAQYHEALGEYLDYYFNQMRAMSQMGATLRRWEARGGDKRDIQDGRELAKMDPDGRIAEAARVNRVWSWHDIARQEKGGQWSFFDVLEEQTEPLGAGSYPLGSRASVALVRIDGYRSGKAGELALADCPWPADTLEGEAWATAFGIGVEDRPPPKPRKNKDDAPAADAPVNGPEAAADAGFADGKQKDGGTVEEGLARRGFEAGSPEATGYAEGFREGLTQRPKRPGKVRQSAVQQMAERAAAMPPTTMADVAKSDWDPDGDFGDVPRAELLN